MDTKTESVLYGAGGAAAGAGIAVGLYHLLDWLFSPKEEEVKPARKPRARKRANGKKGKK